MVKTIRRVVSIALTFAFVMSMVLPSGSTIAVQSGYSSSNLISHSTISVNSDLELTELITSNEWSGKGTEEDPYVIENLDIDAHGAYNAMLIANTHQYLVIRNCYLHNTSVVLGGLPLTGFGGITVYLGSNIILDDNFCEGNGRGITVYTSSSVIVRDNICTGNVHGIGMYSSSNNLITGNELFDNNMDGIHLEVSPNNVIEENNATYNVRAGILITGDCNQNIIANNTCANNSLYGIRASSASNQNIISYNHLTNNTGYGINIAVSTNNLMFNNILEGNRGATNQFNAGHVQGYDSGTNRWNSSSLGNYWGDLTKPDDNHDGIVEVPYALDGGANSDKLPIASSYVHISDPSDGQVVNSSVIIVTGEADPDYDLVINGVMVYVNEDGTFSFGLALIEGTNTIYAKSLNPIMPSEVSLEIVFVNDLRTELESLRENNTELKHDIDELSTRLSALNETTSKQFADIIAYLMQVSERGNDTDARLNDTNNLLLQTREWLQNIDVELAECYASQNLTSDDLAMLNTQVDLMKGSIIELHDSLDLLGEDLNLTEAQLAELENSLNAVMVDLIALEEHIDSMQAEIKTIQGDQLPLMLGIIGSILGAIALTISGLMYLKKRRSP